MVRGDAHGVRAVRVGEPVAAEALALLAGLLDVHGLGLSASKVVRVARTLLRPARVESVDLGPVGFGVLLVPRLDAHDGRAGRVDVAVEEPHALHDGRRLNDGAQGRVEGDAHGGGGGADGELLEAAVGVAPHEPVEEVERVIALAALREEDVAGEAAAFLRRVAKGEGCVPHRNLTVGRGGDGEGWGRGRTARRAVPTTRHEREVAVAGGKEDEFGLVARGVERP